jgi:hypothetical protein
MQLGHRPVQIDADLAALGPLWVGSSVMRVDPDRPVAGRWARPADGLATPTAARPASSSPSPSSWCSRSACRGLDHSWHRRALTAGGLDASLLVQFPLTFASNVFVDPKTMPGWLQAFVDANPVSHLVTAERSLMAAHRTSATSVGWCWHRPPVAVFGPLTMHLYRNKQ